MIGSLIIWCLILFAYFLPTITAAISKRRNTIAIFTLNLLLGWTIIGWIVSLIWAITE